MSIFVVCHSANHERINIQVPDKQLDYLKVKSGPSGASLHQTFAAQLELGIVMLVELSVLTSHEKEFRLPLLYLRQSV